MNPFFLIQKRIGNKGCQLPFTFLRRRRHKPGYKLRPFLLWTPPIIAQIEEVIATE